MKFKIYWGDEWLSGYEYRSWDDMLEAVAKSARTNGFFVSPPIGVAYPATGVTKIEKLED